MQQMEERARSVHALRLGWLNRLYDPVVRYTTREATFKEQLIAAAGIDEYSTVVDPGCGTGTLAVWIAERYPSAIIWRVDGDAAVLDIARTKASARRVDVRLVRSLATRLSFPDSSVDRVVSTLFFHHLSPADKRICLPEIFRVLKPAGELHVADWGKPANVLMRTLFLSVRLLDGFENTHDNVAGFLPRLMLEAGATNASSTSQIDTVYGTLALYRASRA